MSRETDLGIAMKVNSFNIEFGYELLSAVPYAYELYLNGQLTETESGYDTDPLYYFSPKHTENNKERSWFNTDGARKAGLPYTFIHKQEQPDKQFPPYKEVYADKEFRYKKPTVCICNRYNKEWNHKPINYFDEDILDWMFSALKKKYEIVYFPVSIPKEIQDNEKPLKLGDIEVARKHGVRVFTDMIEGRSWNDTMLRVFASCERFITMNGGYSIMASFFSGTNIVYSKPGEVQTREIPLHSFERWYPNINNVRTVYVPSYDNLKRKIQQLYMEDLPCLNILVRTHRKNYFRNCYQSIAEQTYQNINIVAICDSAEAVKYTRDYPIRMVRVEKCPIPKKPEGEDYGKAFPYNRYLDAVQNMVSGYIMFLDDDDCFTNYESVERIMQNVSEDSLTLWKVDFHDKVIPSFSFGKKPMLYDITGIGMCYHSKHVDKTDWSEWKRADYRTAKKLSDTLDVVWVDEVLTAIQDTPGMGIKPDLTDGVSAILIYPDGRRVKQLFSEEDYKEFLPIYKNQGICIELQK